MKDLFYRPAGKINGAEILDPKVAEILYVLGPDKESYDGFLDKSNRQITEAINSIFSETSKILKKDKSLHASQAVLALLVGSIEDLKNPRYEVAKCITQRHISKLICKVASNAPSFDQAPAIETGSWKGLPNRRVALFATNGIAVFDRDHFKSYPGTVYSLQSKRTDQDPKDSLPSDIINLD